jgi:hypothetical protein
MIDKTSIKEMLVGSNHCPHCEEHEIKELMNQLVLEEDIEKSTEYAREVSKLCNGCRQDEMSDLKRM